MGRTVGANQAGTVHHEPHRQLLDRHIVDDLVVRALKECRVDGDKRLVALCRQSRSESDRVLFRNSDVECAVRKGLGKNVDAGAARHRGRNGDDLVVFLRFLDQAFAEHLRIGWRI